MRRPLAMVPTALVLKRSASTRLVQDTNYINPSRTTCRRCHSTPTRSRRRRLRHCHQLPNPAARQSRTRAHTHLYTRHTCRHRPHRISRRAQVELMCHPSQHCLVALARLTLSARISSTRRSRHMAQHYSIHCCSLFRHQRPRRTRMAATINPLRQRLHSLRCRSCPTLSVRRPCRCGQAQCPARRRCSSANTRMLARLACFGLDEEDQRRRAGALEGNRDGQAVHSSRGLLARSLETQSLLPLTLFSSVFKPFPPSLPPSLLALLCASQSCFCATTSIQSSHLTSSSASFMPHTRRLGTLSLSLSLSATHTRILIIALTSPRLLIHPSIPYIALIHILHFDSYNFSRDIYLLQRAGESVRL